MEAVSPRDTDAGLANAIQFLKQERRFSSKESPQPISSDLDAALAAKQLRIMDQSLISNELGLYRNAALTLACIEIAHDNLNSAVSRLADVLYLDVNGATNSLPGCKSFDERLSMVIPFVTSIARYVLAVGDYDVSDIKGSYMTSSQRFARFGEPPFSFADSWRKVRQTLTETEQ
jgi:hypothetical protein